MVLTAAGWWRNAHSRFGRFNFGIDAVVTGDAWDSTSDPLGGNRTGHRLMRL